MMSCGASCAGTRARSCRFMGSLQVEVLQIARRKLRAFGEGGAVDELGTWGADSVFAIDAVSAHGEPRLFTFSSLGAAAGHDVETGCFASFGHF